MANFNINKTIIAGRLTADPELRTTQNGVSVTSFTVAVNRRMAKDGETQADFFNVTAWRATAEFVTKYFRKGSSICVTGLLQNRSWEKDGQKHYATEIVADEVYFVDSKNETQPVANTAPAYVPEAYTTQTPQFEELAEDEELPF
jgi:single-strand DNA-binding protein